MCALQNVQNGSNYLIMFLAKMNGRFFLFSWSILRLVPKVNWWHTLFKKWNFCPKIHFGKTLLLNIIWIFAPKFEDLRFYHFDILGKKWRFGIVCQNVTISPSYCNFSWITFFLLHTPTHYASRSLRHTRHCFLMTEFVFSFSLKGNFHLFFPATNLSKVKNGKIDFWLFQVYFPIDENC